MKKLVTSLAFASKRKGLEKGYLRSYWDFIVFNKIAATFGGKVRFIGTGSAPISGQVGSLKNVATRINQTSFLIM